MAAPFVWMLLTSLKTLAEAVHVPPTILPEEYKWSNYSEVLKTIPFLQFFFNTVIMTFGRTVGHLVFSTLAAYAFARINFPGRNFWFVVVLSLLMIPQQVVLIPQYLIMRDFGWLNSMYALIVPGLFTAFGTFLMRQFFLTLPKDLEESGKLDGANHFQIFWHIMLPLVKSALIALTIFTILWSWNDLLWPLIVINSPEKMVLSTGIASLQGEHVTDYPLLMAGTTLAVWPMILIFFFLQRYFIEGIALTGSK